MELLLLFVETCCLPFRVTRLSHMGKVISDIRREVICWKNFEIAPKSVHFFFIRGGQEQTKQ
jgi:hypothetical protein